MSKLQTKRITSTRCEHCKAQGKHAATSIAAYLPDYTYPVALCAGHRKEAAKVYVG